MTACHALSIKRLYGPHIIKVAAKHNLREIASEIGCDGNIDAARIPENFDLRGPATADGVAQLAKSLMDNAGIAKLRKTAVMALELLFMLPATTSIDPRKYSRMPLSGPRLISGYQCFHQWSIWTKAHRTAMCCCCRW